MATAHLGKTISMTPPACERFRGAAVFCMGDMYYRMLSLAFVPKLYRIHQLRNYCRWLIVCVRLYFYSPGH